jgi:hypothetical protein
MLTSIAFKILDPYHDSPKYALETISYPLNFILHQAIKGVISASETKD